jgi:hypothetical protein
MFGSEPPGWGEGKERLMEGKYDWSILYVFERSIMKPTKNYEKGTGEDGKVKKG